MKDAPTKPTRSKTLAQRSERAGVNLALILLPKKPPRQKNIIVSVKQSDICVALYEGNTREMWILITDHAYISPSTRNAAVPTQSIRIFCIFVIISSSPITRIIDTEGKVNFL